MLQNTLRKDLRRFFSNLEQGQKLVRKRNLGRKIGCRYFEQHLLNRNWESLFMYSPTFYAESRMKIHHLFKYIDDLAAKYPDIVEPFWIGYFAWYTTWIDKNLCLINHRTSYSCHEKFILLKCLARVLFNKYI